MITRRASVVPLLILSLATVVSGQSDGWTRYAPSGSNFTILVPTAPEVLPPEKDTTGETNADVFLYRIRTSSLVYIFGWTDYQTPVNVEGENDANRDNFVKAGP